ncbi:methyltransferase [Galbibacter pacificus]|uniref:Methyltransferase n=1 Tax=Galbibacter pacificus TaxID=2996052 RepID=A0ABT6FR52_9FLAO|nr:methyltransferase [Galbibacter pacificus]MDG3581778.1 methyltransferase [Galbibacter pacificus]MDG3585748.1 methyltransferase [Galbibacter pacificus]
MAKLTKDEYKRHEKACEILKKNKLTFDEKIFVMENWHEGADNLNSKAGAFFTPVGLAQDFSLEIIENEKIIDLCAGIGMLAFFAYHYRKCDVMCVELNPKYIEVGKKLLPEAKWINASIFNFKEFGHFEQVISNPPFGKIKTGIDAEIKNELKYKGSEFELITMEIGSKIADYGTFLVPQGSTPFKYSGNQDGFIDLRQNNKGYNPYGQQPMQKVKKFLKETNFNPIFNVGIDTSIYKDNWKGVNPICEVINFDWKGKYW